MEAIKADLTANSNYLFPGPAGSNQKSKIREGSSFSTKRLDILK